jgi:hypothetical protein
LQGVRSLRETYTFLSNVLKDAPGGPDGPLRAHLRQLLHCIPPSRRNVLVAMVQCVPDILAGFPQFKEFVTPVQVLGRYTEADFTAASFKPMFVEQEVQGGKYALASRVLAKLTPLLPPMAQLQMDALRVFVQGQLATNPAMSEDHLFDAAYKHAKEEIVVAILKNLCLEGSPVPFGGIVGGGVPELSAHAMRTVGTVVATRTDLNVMEVVDEVRVVVEIGYRRYLSEILAAVADYVERFKDEFVAATESYAHTQYLAGTPVETVVASIQSWMTSTATPHLALEGK